MKVSQKPKEKKYTWWKEDDFIMHPVRVGSELRFVKILLPVFRKAMPRFVEILPTVQPDKLKVNACLIRTEDYMNLFSRYGEVPELYPLAVPEEDREELKAAVRFYCKEVKAERERCSDMYEDMRMMGAPTEDFAEDGTFDADVHALATTAKRFPEMTQKYFVGFSPKYNKVAPYGMGRYDRFGGL
jgi:hypothetical protein